MNLPHRLLYIISPFLSNREGFIDINAHYTELFDINVGSPKAVCFPLFFLFFTCDFLSEVEVKFKFAADCSAIISAFNTDTLHSTLQAVCHNIEFWCKKWRMVVNGSKTELLLLNCLADNTEPILLYGERCKTKQTTKSLGLTIDTNLTYREHTSITTSKASTSWRLLKSKCSNRWGLSIPTQAYLYKTIIRPQLSYAESIWAQRNYASLLIVQNRIIRSIMKHSMSPKITAIEVLMGIPPIDIYCSSIEIKFLIKAVNKDDLVTATHVKTLTRPSSLSSLLLSKLLLVLPCMYRRNIKLSQINICGMSNHSQIALNKFINITNPYVLCINETEKDMTSDKFDKYTWYQLSMETTAKVLPCLYIPAFLIYEYMISKIFILTAFGL